MDHGLNRLDDADLAETLVATSSLVMDFVVSKLLAHSPCRGANLPGGWADCRNNSSYHLHTFVSSMGLRQSCVRRPGFRHAQLRAVPIRL